MKLSQDEFREMTMGCFYQDELREHDSEMRLTEIDRAMEWCVENLRWCEVESDKENFWMDENDYTRWADDNIDTCISYLEKVEQELEGE